jgi:hypothetical protein
VKRATHNGWLSERGFRGSDAELRTLFAMRWLELTRLRSEPALRSSLAELRRYHRFLLLYPERGSDQVTPELERARRRLRYVESLAHQDHEYPAALARGTLLAELGAGPQSVEVLSAYLARPSGTAWPLRAKNYLLYAARGTFAQP